jgi:hypothetical protein
MSTETPPVPGDAALTRPTTEATAVGRIRPQGRNPTKQDTHQGFPTASNLDFPIEE